MKADFFERFHKTITEDSYEYQSRKKRLVQLIHEDDYEISLSYVVSGDYAVSFRIEDIKAAAHYLKGHDRAAGKDNDCTIIDDCIYQFEVKHVKHIGNANPKPQFLGGLQWLRHLMWLVAASDNDMLKVISKLPIYNIVIFIPKHGRGMVRHRGKAKFIQKDDYFLLTLDNPAIKMIDLTKFKWQMSSSNNYTTISDTVSLMQAIL